MRLVSALVLALALVPAAASALTVNDVVALSKSGVSDEVILAMIERDKTIFTIDPADVIALERQGLSERVVIAMLKSGRDEAASAAEAVAPFASSTSPAATEPYTVVVGHGPDRPNTFGVVDYVVPIVPAESMIVPVYVPAPVGGCATGSPPPASTLGQFINDPSARFVNDGSNRFINTGINTGLVPPQAAVAAHCAEGGRPAARPRRQRMRR